MRVLVTGAGGHVGSTLVPELIAAGHEVTGLARSDASATKIEQLGAAVQRGDIEDLDGLRAAARKFDGVVNLAFPDDRMAAGDLLGAVAIDLAAVKAIGEELVGTGKVFVGVTGMLILAGLDHVGTEKDIIASGPRVDVENYAISLADKDVRSIFVRFSPVIHGAEGGKAGFATALIAIARQTGVSAYVGEGTTRWPAAPTRDTARLLRLALEKAPAGSRLHAVAEEGVSTKEIATAIGDHLGLPVKGVTPEDAADHFGFLAGPLQTDIPTSSTITRSLLGWHPSGPGLLEDLRDDRYYAV